MDAKRFLTEFGHIVSAPGGVQQLRQMIYSLAITGDLTRRLADDGDAESLLRDIERTKARLIEEKAFKRSPKLENRLLPPPANIKLPDSWRWSRLIDIGEINPKNKAADDTLASFIPMSGIPQIHSGRLEAEQYPWGQIKRGFTHFADGDVALAKITPCFENGKAAVITGLTNGIGAGTTELHVVRPLHGLIESGYVYIFLRSPYFTAEGENNMTGTAGQKRLPTEYFATRPFPLPPTAEQKRIVAKVDELMALCDKLEAQQQEREVLGKLTRSATLRALSDAEDSRALRAAWSRVQANLNLLLDGEQVVMDFREALKKLAVRGLLSEWTEEHPSIDEIKADCAALKREYLRKNWLRKQKLVISRVTEKSRHPSHWAVVPFDDVAVVIGGITIGRKLKGKDVKSCPYLRVANVQRGFFDLGEIKHIEVPIDEIAKYRVEKGDILITEGGDWDKVGRTAIWAGAIPECLHQNHVFKARAPSALLLNEWVELVFNSDVGRDYFARAAKQTTNLASINMAQLRSFPLPIPPFSEQIEILQKVKRLLSICKKLEQQGLDSQNIARSLAIATVTSITGFRIKEKEKMKAPKTELVSTLRVGVSPTNGDRAPLTATLLRNNGELPAKMLWTMSALDIDAFYQQLKIEMAKGWIVQPEAAYVKVVEVG